VIPPDDREYIGTFRYWEKGGPSKLKLAEEMLTRLTKSISAKDIWVTFDSWYFTYPLCSKIEDLGLNWVSRAKNPRSFTYLIPVQNDPARASEAMGETESEPSSLQIPQNASSGWYHDFGTVYIARSIRRPCYWDRRTF